MLTLHQPWASLIAVGVKTIETRSWSTPYRGPLAIHAGKATPPVRGPGSEVGGWNVWRDPHNGSFSMRFYDAPAVYTVCRLPLGAVVAVADLVDVVPIIDGSIGWTDDSDTPPAAVVVSWDSHAMLVDTRETVPFPDITEQLPFGDFAHGRFAWMLENVRAIEPVPAKGHQGLRDVRGDVLVRVLAELEAVTHG